MGLQLFPHQHYVKQLEETFYKGARQDSTLDSKEWIRSTVSRLYRLSLRHNFEVNISNDRMMETVMRCLPLPLERHIRSDPIRYTYESLWERASLLEAEGIRVSSFAAEQVEEIAMAEKRGASSSAEGLQSQVSRQMPTKPCPACGEVGHWRIHCPKRNSRCYNCQLVGHVAKACRNSVVKD